MTAGSVSAYREAIIPLELRGARNDRRVVDAVVDTGFTDYLALPAALLQSLQATLVGTVVAALADGRSVALATYLLTVEWDGQSRQVTVLEADGGPLVGMALLQGSRLTVEVVDDGSVAIEPLPGPGVPGP